MALTLDEFLEQNKITLDEAAVEREKKRMIAEIRAYKLRELRRRLRIPQQALARALHISQPRISQIENGEIDSIKVGTLKRYVEAVGGHLRIEITVNGHTTLLDS